MYSFHARRDGELNCRHWLSAPEGCKDTQCRYSHTITGVMAPPSMFACYAYNDRGCPLAENECLFTHAFTDPSSQYRQVRHPGLSLRDVPIAEAAAKAGFDCGNWIKLKILIDAVRAVNAPVSYPDRWTGPAAYQSSIYPDHWTPAHQARQEKSVIHAYPHTQSVPSVPAFVISAPQILKNISNLPRVKGTAGAPAMMGTGSNRTPLGPISGNKRGGDEVISSSQKRHKSAHIRPPASLTYSAEPMHYAPTSRPRPPQASTKPTKAARSKPSKSQRKARQRAVAKNQTSRETIGTLAQIASKLRASAHAVDVDRDTLRQRWEVDENLQLQSVTDHLGDLNECFGRAEDGIRDALEVIEKRLL